MTTPQAGGGLPGRVLAYHDLARRPAGAGLDPGGDLASLRLIGTAIRCRALLCGVAAAGGILLGAGFYVLAPPPQAASTSILLTQNPREDPAKTAQTDVALARTRSVAEPVLHRLGLSESVGAFIASYSVVPVTDRLLVITCDAPSSAEAVRRSAALAAQFLRFRASELLLQQQLGTRSLAPKVGQARRRVAAIAVRMSRVAAQSASPLRRAALGKLHAEWAKATIVLAGLLNGEATSQATTAAMIAGSGVLDPAAPVPRSRRLPAVYAAAGLVGGLAGAMAFIAVGTLTTDRPRRREDVAIALGAPVQLSVSARRWALARRLRAPARLAPASVGKIVGYLRRVVARLAEDGPAALAVVAVRDTRIAALSVASLAASLARDGERVLVADLAAGHPAARLLGVTKPGIHIGTGGERLLVAVPDPADVAPAGPIPAGSQARSPHVSPQLADAYVAADVLLTLADPDPVLGTEHLTSWAAGAVVMLGAGRSSAARIHAVGEAIRLDGPELISAILVCANKSDQTLGAAVASAPGRRLPARGARVRCR